MSSSEITRSGLVRALVEFGSLLTGPKPLAERLTGLCAAAAAVLNCDQVAIMQLIGDEYRGMFQHGMPESLMDMWPQYRVPRSKPIVSKIEACDSYLLYNRANTDPDLSQIARVVGVVGVVIVPFTHPDGTPFGYLIASYQEDKPTVTEEEAELATGIARMAQTTMLRQLETQRRREVSQAMLEVADSERRRLSRDIHDDPLQRILGLRVGLEGFRAQLEEPAMRSAIDGFIGQCRSASSSLREVMLQTHPHVSELADLRDVLATMVARNEGGSAVTLNFSDERSIESPSYLIPALNRVAEQAARNTLRHAAATMLGVSLSDRDGGTLLTITDDGRGFDVRDVDNTRLGLVLMRERTELLDGVFAIDTMPGAGTVVSAWFPHAEPSNA